MRVQWDLYQNQDITIPKFVFAESIGEFKGKCRGWGPISADLKEYHDPIGVWDDKGNYYSFTIDNRDSKKKKTVQFIIGEEKFYYKIYRCYTIGRKVDPVTGN